MSCPRPDGRRARRPGAPPALLALALLLLSAAPSAAQVDPGQAPAPHAPFALPFEATDAVFDAARGMLYATSAADQRVYFVDLATGLATRQFDFPWQPEHLTLTPDGSRLFVTLLTRPHSPYWFDGDGHEGYVASFDLDLQVKDRQLWIPEDPFGIAATSDGRLVVSSGSGQWTRIQVLDAATGAPLGTVGSIRERSYVSLHPGEDAVYTSGGTSYPQDLHRWELGPGGAITYAWDSIYHGDHRISGAAWVVPQGDVVISQGGDVFSVGGATRATDLLFQGGLTPGPFTALHFDVARNVILTAEGDTLSYYNLASREWIGDGPPASGDIDFVGAVGLSVYTLASGPSGSLLEVSAHLVPHGDTNQPPVAAFDVRPATGRTTQTDLTLDASASHDAESGLLYRWDLEDDGAWDTPFSTDPFLVHRFATAGTKLVRLQVKDDAGAVDSLLQALDVAFEVDPGVPGDVHASFTLPFEVADVVFDPVRPYLYVSSRDRREVHFVNLETGFIERTFSFPWMAESLAVTPDGSRLYVALLTRDHSSYWFDRDGHEGYIASFDLDLQVKDRQFFIPEDPFDLLATSNGQLVVSSGSGQWTYARVFDGTSGALLSSVSFVRQRTRLSLHPSEAIVYGADTDSSPSDIERYDLDPAGQLSLRFDSQYHGDHRMAGNVWASPLGDLLVTRGGDVFTAAGADRQSDMLYLRALTPSSVDALAWDPLRNVIFTGRDGELAWYNLQSLESVGQTSLSGDVSYVGVDGLDVYAVQVEAGETRILRLDHPLPHGDTDTPPSVAYAIHPEGVITTLSDVLLDASGSSDLEGALLYRWDLDGDGVWDTAFSSDPELVKRFDTAGTKQITVQVKDEGGFVSEATFSIDVVFEPDVGDPGPENPPFVLPFPVSDVVFDTRRPYAYVSSRESKRVYFVNLHTGRVERSFPFAFEPESLAITPDGSRLYAALLTRDHSYYWFDRDGHEGYIASFDLDRRVKDRQFWIPEDPYDLVATSNGQLVVSSGSGQWTYARAFDGETGALLSSISGVRQRTRLALHPSEAIVYGADTDLGPSDIERYDLDPSGQLSFRFDSQYHGDHRMWGNVWASPLGDRLVTRGGDVFTAAGADRQSDMLYVGSLVPDIVEALAFDAHRNVIFTGRDGEVSYHNLDTLEDIGAIPVEGDVRFLGVLERDVYAVAITGSGEGWIAHIEHPVPEGDTDTPPVARIGVEPGEGYTTQIGILLDGSASEDAQGPVVYRWDLDGDGVFDTAYSGEPTLLHRYSIAGTRFVRLRVKDSAGNIAEAVRQLDVAFEPDPGVPGPVHPGYRLPFEAADAVFDPVRPYLYGTSLAQRTLYVVDLDSGFVVRAFAFAEMPEHMAISPDGSKLYVALLTQDHSAYQFDEDGAIARIDLDLLVKDRQFSVPIDPYDLAATSDGGLVITSGSGQWTQIAAFDGDTGALRGAAGHTIRERSTVSLHPSEAMVYTAGGTSYPQDVLRWDFDAAGGLRYAWDSVYHGQHRVGNDLWVSPAGDVLVTSGGDVFSADGASRDTDILYLHSFPATGFLDLVWTPAEGELAVTDGAHLRVYDTTSYAELASFALASDARFLGRRGALLYAVEVGNGETGIERLDR